MHDVSQINPLGGVAVSKQCVLLFTDTFMYILGFRRRRDIILEEEDDDEA